MPLPRTGQGPRECNHLVVMGIERGDLHHSSRGDIRRRYRRAELDRIQLRRRAYVVANCVVTLPFVHCTTEHGRMLPPVTIKVAAEAPAVATVGETDMLVGAGSNEGEIVKGSIFDRARNWTPQYLPYVSAH